MEFLVTMTTRVPDGVSEAEVDEVRAKEAARSRELTADGQLVRLWRPPLRPGEWRTFGLFRAADAESQDVEETVAAEATSSARLAEQGKLERLWRLPDGSSLGLWQTTDDIELEAILTSLPLAPWLQIDTVPLTTHPSDPAHLTK